MEHERNAIRQEYVSMQRHEPALLACLQFHYSSVCCIIINLVSTNSVSNWQELVHFPPSFFCFLSSSAHPYHWPGKEVWINSTISTTNYDINKRQLISMQLVPIDTCKIIFAHFPLLSNNAFRNWTFAVKNLAEGEKGWFKNRNMKLLVILGTWGLHWEQTGLP